MWIKRNPNPLGKEAPDCVVRALCITLDRSWTDIYDELCALGRVECNMPSADAVWGKYLYEKGFEPFLLPLNCPKCVSVRKFCEMYSVGRYVVGTGSHAVAVIDGDYYDSWDSGDLVPSFFWSLYWRIV